MKDFDALRTEREQRERSFKIAGREFTFRAAIPAETYSLYLELMDQMSAGHWPQGSFETLNATMLALLDEGSSELWGEVVAARDGHPVSFEDIADIIDYCVGVTTGRPTLPRSPSGHTGESGGTRLTVASDLPAAPAQTA